MGNNYFEIIGTVKKISIFNTVQEVPSFFRNTDQVKEIVLLLEVPKKGNTLGNQMGFHIWLSKYNAPLKDYDDSYFLSLVTKKVKLKGYIEIYTGCEEEIGLEVTKILPCLNPLN